MAGAPHPVPNGEVGPGGEEAYGHEQIMDMMHGLKPDQVFQAGDLLTGLAGKVDDLLTGLQKAAGTAGAQWSGTAAEAAMAHIQDLHDQGAEFSAQARTVGNTLHWLGGDVMPKFQAIPSPQIATGWKNDVASFAKGLENANNENYPHQYEGEGNVLDVLKHGGPGTAKANAAAQGYLTSFNGHLQTANNTFPTSLSAPGSQASSTFTTGPGSTSATGGGSGGSVGYGGSTSPSAAIGGGSVPGYSSSSSANPFAASQTHSGSTAPSSTGSLQGYTAPTVSTPAPYGAGPATAAGRTSLNPFEGLMPTPAAGPTWTPRTPEDDPVSPDDNLPLKRGPGPDDPAPNSPVEDSAGSETAGSEARAAGAAEGEGSSGMPMGAGGGGGGAGDKERQRQAWMSEDTSIWGATDTHICPVLE